MKYIKYILFLLGTVMAVEMRADEGMWMIHALDAALEKKMQERGLELSAREIYNADAPGSSVADAVVSLEFGCTGSIISDQGLLITNHHCAYGDVHKLSTPEHNYLEEGFWAMTSAEEKNIKIATYASRCIENEILMYFRSQKKASQDISINESIDSDSEGNSLTLMDIISIDDTIADEISQKIQIKQLYDFIENIKDEREKTIIILRYGLYNCEPLTQKQIAQKLNISRSYVSRIEKKIIENLRKSFLKKEKVAPNGTTFNSNQ